MNGKTLLLVGVAALLLFGLKKEPGTDSATDPGATGDQTLLQAWIDKIKSTPEWYALILEKAAASGKTVQQQLEFDANWVIQQGWQLT